MAKLIGIKIVATKSGKDGYEYHFADEFDVATVRIMVAK